MTSSFTACPTCSTPGSGSFCSNCGAARQRSSCRGCAGPLAAGARFCPQCGLTTGADAPATRRERTPWLIAAAAMAALLAVLLVMVTRNSRGPAVPLLSEQPLAADNPPDISNLSPRERFNRLYNRIMTAAQAGDEATAQRFMPMALMAYGQLDTVDADARYHAALLKAHTGDVEASRALGDTILAQHPAHLFGYVVRGTVARFRKDQKALAAAYGGFLKRYDQEMKADRPEYAEHRTSLEEFRKAALQATSGAAGAR